MSAEVEERIRKAAVLNAIRHGGKADSKAVLGNLLGDNPDLRGKARELVALVQKVVQETNSKSLTELETIAKLNWPDEIVRERVEEVRTLPPLPNASGYPLIVTRIAPNPDFVLHIGNARAAILCHDYARMYKGKFIVRFEDTDPRLKKAQLQYYDMIREDLLWLGCEWDEECIQSDRLEIYYDVGRTLLAKGAAYVCECEQEQFRDLVNRGVACPDRDLPANKHIERWNKMLEGGYGEGQAVVRVKTDLSHPNPAIRDWPGLRVIDTKQNPHPRVGSKYCVWPLYNLACGVDDHELGITHVIRGKEHLTNMARQRYLYAHMGWKYPDAVHYGRLKVEGMDLSKSRLMKALELGEVAGVDDPRLGTLAALRRRGYSPEAIRKLIWDVGPKPVDVTISWDNLNSLNRKIIDPTSPRFYFVPDPVKAKVSGVEEEYEVKALLHPHHPEMGTRTLRIQPRQGVAEFYLAGSDSAIVKPNQSVRLMGLFNIRIVGLMNGQVNAEFTGENVSEAEDVPMIQWVPAEENIPTQVVLPDATIRKGLAEVGLRSMRTGSVIQFVRFGFGRVDSNSSSGASVYFAHQ
jgi:glutamyl-tRNA synthetase